MNIGIIHGFVGGGGGTEKTLGAIIDSLEKTEHTVTLYTFSKPKMASKKIRIKTILPISLTSFGLYQRVMESKLIVKAKDEDLLIQTSGGLGIPQRQDQKIIIYCHSDFSSELDNPVTKYKGIWSLYYKLYYNMIKKFTKNIQDSRINLVSNSKHVHDSIYKNFEKESHIIYPPVDLNEFSPEKKEDRVVTVGRFSEEKNLEFGIDVMKNIDCKYTIIGNTNTKPNMLYYEKLENKTKNANLTKIQLQKNLPRSDLVNILNKTKVYFHCSRETFGISTIEGIAAGCIPIVPNVGGHLEAVPYSELRYEENDIDDAQKTITKALDGSLDNLKQPLADSIKKYDKQEFTKNFLYYIEKL